MQLRGTHLAFDPLVLHIANLKWWCFSSSCKYFDKGLNHFCSTHMKGTEREFPA